MKQEYSGGTDSKGSIYSSIDEMWDIELKNKKNSQKVVQPVGSQQNWYKNGNQYWQKTQATYDGVLGGFANLSPKDINYSLKFFIEFVKQHPQTARQTVLDCGTGIGRISKQLLCQLYKTVDVIDQCEKFIQKAKQFLKDKNIRHFYCKGLQQFEFEQKYDCIWIQWVLSQLTDQSAINFFLKCKKSLNKNGIIILKENHCSNGFAVDKDDNSVTRSRVLFEKLFNKAQLKIIKQQKQKDWPSDLFQIRMYALQ